MMEELANEDQEDSVVDIWMQMVSLEMAHKVAPSPVCSLPDRAENLEQYRERGHRRMMLNYFWSEDLKRDDESGNKGTVYPEDKF